jgi:GT2 family glycosyltransferase
MRQWAVVWIGAAVSRLGASVIICSRGRPALLQDAVDSVLRGTVLPAEIIIVDQSDSPDERLAARARVAECEVRYLWDDARGVSRARNRGLELARSDIVAFTDDDVLVDAGWLEALVTTLADMGHRGIVTGRVLAAATEIPGGWAPALVHSEQPATYEGRITRDVLEAGNMAGFRDTLLEVRGFDPTLGPGTPFPAGEDNDLGLRLLSAGCRIRYEPTAVIYHRAWRGPEEYLRLRWGYGIGQGGYYAKYLSLRDRFMLRRLGRVLGIHLRMAVRRARGEPRAAAGHLTYVAGVLTGVARRWAQRFHQRS